MATMARITTTSSAAAMMTAAVGLSPKIVVRSEVTVRGSAEPSSLFAAELLDLVSLRDVVVDGSLAGALDFEPLAESGDDETVPLADPDGVDTEPLADPLGLVLVWAMAPPTSPKVTRAMSRRTATLFMLHLQGVGIATAVPPGRLATMTRSRR
jgi:hypothetical protein